MARASKGPTRTDGLVILVLTLSLVCSSLAATINVCATGCAFDDIATAVSVASDADTIAIQGGTFASTPAITVARRITLWAVAPVTINGLGVWMTVASSNVTTRGTFTLMSAGIVVAPNSTWYQEGPLTIRHTTTSAGFDGLGQPFGAASAIVVNGGAWMQRALVAITARTVAIEMAGTRTLWDQRGPVEIDVPANGVAGDAHYGIVFGCNQAAWEQRAPATIRVGVGAGIRMGTMGSTAWNQSAALDITVTATQATGAVTGVALGVGSLGATATWVQWVDTQVHLVASGIGAVAEGVTLDANDNRHEWNMIGWLNTTATAQNGALVRVVRMGQRSSTWRQRGAVLVAGTTRSNGTVHAVTLGAGAWAGNSWEQSGPVNVEFDMCADGSLAPVVPSAGVRGTWRCATWRSMGSVNLTLSTHKCVGATVAAHPMWFDSRGCNFTLDRAVLTGQGDAQTVRCDTAPAPTTPAFVRGLPLGTLTQGACPDLVLLPVADVHPQGQRLVVGWTRPAVVRAYATAPLTGNMPFILSSNNVTLIANASTFVFSGSVVSDPVAVTMVDQNGPLGSDATLTLLPTSGALLAEIRHTSIEILPWIVSADLAGTSYTALVDTSGSTLIIVPKDHSNQNMTVRFEALVERDANSTVVRTLALGSGTGRWQNTTRSALTPGAAQEFVMTVFEGNDNETVVDLVVALFDRRVEAVFDGGLAFSGDPALAKTSVRIRRWPHAEGRPIGRVELVMAVGEPLVNTSRTDDPNGATTTYTINGGNHTGNGTVIGRKTIRLSTDALADGRLLRGSVGSHVDTTDSAIVILLPYFQESLVYDPDLGVLFGSPSNGDPSTSDPADRGASSFGAQSLIIAVAASVGTAVVVVAAAVALVVGVVWYRQRRLKATVGSTVAFDPESPRADQQQQL